VVCVYLGVGSNIDPEKNLRFAIGELRRHFAALELSVVYRSRPVGFDGPDFLNLVVRCRTSMPPADVLAVIEAIHDGSGRRRKANRFASRNLDIDLLLYGDAVLAAEPYRIPRADILDYAFVLRPLAEIAPDLVHPVTGKTMAEHWRAFEAAGQLLEPVDLIL